jgi:hypothetical protein
MLSDSSMSSGGVRQLFFSSLKVLENGTDYISDPRSLYLLTSLLLLQSAKATMHIEDKQLCSRDTGYSYFFSLPLHK